VNLSPIAVNLPAVQVSRISHQEPVFAVVPANAQEASRVLPVADMAVQASMIALDTLVPRSKPDAPSNAGAAPKRERYAISFVLA
jgi:hypothetical protein